MSKTDADTIRFRALQLANEHRNAYGLRYNDFTRYRKHCGNRTHRLRSSLKMTHGKGRDFKKLPPITLENIKPGHLELLLFETERAWAYSQEIYTTSLQPANKERAAKLRHSATSRFRRAIHWCTQLLSHCQALSSAQRLRAQNLLEVNAYTLILSGRFLRFRDEYEDALDQLCVARQILSVLEENAGSSRDQALATFWADEIGPEIRYCAHQMGQENAYDVERIVREVAPKHQDQLVEGYAGLVERLKTEGRGETKAQGRKRLRELVWEGKPVPVRNPELVDVLLKVQDAEEPLKPKAEPADGYEEKEVAAAEQQGEGKTGKRHHKSRKGVAAFDAILAALSDAEEVARKLAEAQKATSGSTNIAPGSRDIHFLHDFIIFQLLSRRVERDLTLISALIASSHGPRARTSKTDSKNAPAKTTKNDDNKKNTGTGTGKSQGDARVNPAIVKLLDSVVQSLEHMRSLSIVEESSSSETDLAGEVEARLAFTKSRRCVYLARSYAAVKQYAQALTLCQRSHLHIREASATATVSSSSSSTPPPAIGSRLSFYPLTQKDVADLESQLTEDEERFKRDWFAFNGGSATTKQVKDSKKKPLFFDIALNYVQLDMDRLQQRAGLVPATKTRTDAKGKDREKQAEKEAKVATKAKKEEIERPETPEPSPAAAGTARAGGGLSSLLGGWWGRK